VFTGEFNPVQHTVKRGVCVHCKQPFHGDGAVYTKQGFLLSFVPEKYNICEGVK
jgi:hypothetical protein